MARASTQRKRRTRPPAQRSAKSAEDLMFFPKLRRRAKWVFLLLAIAFGGGFLIFGVGAGGSGIGDYVADILNRPVSADGPGLEDAREAVADKPNNPAARLDLARAAQREARVDEAIGAYESYRAMRPEDEDALRSLAALYGQRIAEAQRRAAIASNEAQEASLPQTFAPEDSPFLQEITGNAISERVSSRAEARAQTAGAEAQRLARLQLDVFADLTLIVEDDPLLFLQFAQASENAQDYESAIAAYEQFLDLAPNNPNAEQVEQRIEALKLFAQQAAGGSGDAPPGGSDGE
jgi:tetratricopeptide (TPR) repeat protein